VTFTSISCLKYRTAENTKFISYEKEYQLMFILL